MQLTRREAMIAGAGALAAGFLPACQNKHISDHDPLVGDIDAHSHVWSDDLKNYPLGPWATTADMKPYTFTDDQLLEIMRANGVGRCVLIQHAPLHGYDNSYILDCATRRPGTFSVVAMINERKPHLKERLRDLRDRGARGIRITPTKHADRTLNVDPPNWLKAPGMELLWQHAAELGVAVCPLISGEFLPTLVPMCKRHPDTVCVIDHFAHLSYGQADQMQAITDLSAFPNVYFKVSAFYKFSDPPYDGRGLARMIEICIDAFGPNRLMWASDAPYQMRNGHNYEDALALIREGLPALSDADRRAILRGTAERVFF